MANKFARWIKEGYGCESCPAGWSEYSCDEYDGGCYVFGDNWPVRCRLPRWAARLLARRGKYLVAHEFDGYEKWWAEHEKDETAFNAAYSAALRETTMRNQPEVIYCWKDTDGRLHEFGENWIIFVLNRTKSAYSDYLHEKEKRTLTQRWRELFKLTADKTIMRPIRFILSYIMP